MSALLAIGAGVAVIQVSVQVLVSVMQQVRQ